MRASASTATRSFCPTTSRNSAAAARRLRAEWGTPLGAVEAALVDGVAGRAGSSEVGADRDDEDALRALLQAEVERQRQLAEDLSRAKLAASTDAAASSAARAAASAAAEAEAAARAEAQAQSASEAARASAAGR